jgi:hypothetical protein
MQEREQAQGQITRMGGLARRALEMERCLCVLQPVKSQESDIRGEHWLALPYPPASSEGSATHRQKYPTKARSASLPVTRIPAGRTMRAQCLCYLHHTNQIINAGFAARWNGVVQGAWLLMAVESASCSAGGKIRRHRPGAADPGIVLPAYGHRPLLASSLHCASHLCHQKHRCPTDGVPRKSRSTPIRTPAARQQHAPAGCGSESIRGLHHSRFRSPTGGKQADGFRPLKSLCPPSTTKALLLRRAIYLLPNIAPPPPAPANHQRPTQTLQRATEHRANHHPPANTTHRASPQN